VACFGNGNHLRPGIRPGIYTLQELYTAFFIQEILFFFSFFVEEWTTYHLHLFFLRKKFNEKSGDRNSMNKVFLG